MNAWADGLNYYLATHPNVKPRVITKFEPWMPLTFSEGSIGGDIESVDLGKLRAFYDKGFVAVKEPEDLTKEPTGSNGIAISPSNTKNKKALLLINPHTSFFFRSELQMTSGEGLNAYGASTWGQFFIYQGFNEHCGWMHTSSEADSIDEWLETVVRKDGKVSYKYGAKERPMTIREISISVKTASGIVERKFTTYHTHHGPVVRTQGGKWVAVGLMNEPVKALMQSYGRIKAKNYNEFKKVMELQANSSNATLYADADGNTAYFHPNFMPRRNPKFDWTKPVDGSDPATDWKGLLSFDELPNIKNPASGWVYNSNNWPWSAAGPSSLKQSDFPNYVDSGYESARGLHAIKVLENKTDLTLDTLRDAAYDTYLTWFDKRLPVLIKAWETLPNNDPLKAKTADQIAILKKWDQRWSTDSVATSVAVYWGQEVTRKYHAEWNRPLSEPSVAFDERSAVEQQDLLGMLVMASDKLTADFGTWQTPWGEINRFQRITDDIVHPFTRSPTPGRVSQSDSRPPCGVRLPPSA